MRPSTPYGATRAASQVDAERLALLKSMVSTDQGQPGAARPSRNRGGVCPAAPGSGRLDGSELSHWDPEQLGQHLGYLPQDVELFGGTIAENICRFGEVDDEKIVMAAQMADVHDMIQRLPEGYNTALEGQFQAQEQASQRMAWLSLISLGLIFMVLYSRYRSVVLTAIIMANIPLALVGSVVALWWSGQPLSVAALVGFITLTGVATRNGILKISHYINLCRDEGETFGQTLIVRGSLERLTPVWMTALVAAFALLPLLMAADAPGKEILHPVAVVIFGGLISATLLDTVLTPVMFWLWGRQALERMLDAQQGESF